MPEMTTIAILRPNAAYQPLDAPLWLIAAKFHKPVMMRRAKAGQAIRLKARAILRGASPPRARSVGTKPATTNCPPTQIVAASTWSEIRSVVMALAVWAGAVAKNCTS